jgi:hypothetical protein
MPHDRVPARDAKLGALLGEPKHPVAVRDRYEQVHGRFSRDVRDPNNAHIGAVLGEASDGSDRLRAPPIGDVHAASNLEPTDAHVMRSLLVEPHRVAGGESRAVGEESG